MATKKNEVTEVKNTLPSTETKMPDFMSGAPLGTEHLTNSDVELPRLVLLQATSPQVSDADATPGAFFHTLLEEEMGKEMEIIPLHISTRYMLWKPRHDGGGILARADDGVHWSPPNAEFQVKPIKDSDLTVTWATKPTVSQSGLDKWGSSNPNDPKSEPAATKMLVIVAMVVGREDIGPVVITLQRSAESVGKRLYGRLKLSNAPIYGQRFKMSVTKDRSPKGDAFYNYSFERVGFVEDEDLFKLCRSFHEAFATNGVKVNLEEDAPVSDSSAASAGEEKRF